jgi:hypothetical protein
LHTFHAGIPNPNAFRKPFSGPLDNSLKRLDAKLFPSVDGEIFTMITFKLVALVVGAGTLLVTFALDFGQDLFLAIVTCLS